MGRGCLILVFFLGAVVLGYILALLTYVAIVELTGFEDREGAWAIGVAAQIGPAVALACGGLAAWWIAARPDGSR